jgi:hypothetical protein
MMLLRLPSLLLLCAPALLLAQASAPSLKSILSETEWKRAGLDRLTPDEIGVIDAALIRHHRGATTELRAELESVRQEVATAKVVSRERSLLERFGLPILSDVDWRELPPMRGKVVAWETANRFKLDNGQMWEGLEPIPYELVGKNVEITARPAGRFQLMVEGRNTTLRVIRLR